MRTNIWRMLLLLGSLLAARSSGADESLPPRALVPPRCGSRAFTAMTDATRRHCRAEPQERVRASCNQLVGAMRDCTAGVRVERAWITVHIPLGGEWVGARFEQHRDGWSFVTLVGGDVP